MADRRVAAITKRLERGDYDLPLDDVRYLLDHSALAREQFRQVVDELKEERPELWQELLAMARQGRLH